MADFDISRVNSFIENTGSNLAVCSGQQYLDELVQHLGPMLDSEIVLIGSKRLAEIDRIQVHSVYFRGGNLDIVEYEACDIACREVIDGQVKVIARDLQKCYPNTKVYGPLNLQTYVGIPLIGSSDQVIGLLFYEGTSALTDDQAQTILNLLSHFGLRTGNELEGLLSKQMLANVVGNSISQPSKDIFRSLSLQIANSLLVRTVFIAACMDDDPEHFRVLAYSFSGKSFDQAVGALVPYRITPCQLLKKQDTVFLPRSLQEKYPEAELAIEQGLIAYVATVLRDSKGKIIGHIAMLHDRELTARLLDSPILQAVASRISVELERFIGEQHRNQMESLLLVRQKSESLGLLAGTIAHDFNNLLASMLGYTELALDHLPSNSEAQEFIAKTLNVSLSGRSMVRQLLDYAGNSSPVTMRLLDLNVLLRSIVDLVPSNHVSKTAIKLSLSTRPLYIQGDQTRLSQFAMNLIINALDALDEQPGEIVISTSIMTVTESLRSKFIFSPMRIPDECVMLEIRDTGIGMTSDVMAKIFDPFFTTKKQGKGLGMASIQGIVRQHNAALWIDSKPAKGTSIRAFFTPASLSDISLASSEETADLIVDSSLEKKQILVIDDQPEVRDVVSMQLAALNYNVDRCGSCDEAVELLKQDHHYWAAVIDIVMPGCDGWETLKRLQLIAPDMQAIMMTGFEPPKNTDNDNSTSDIAIINKPFQRTELAMMLSKLKS